MIRNGTYTRISGRDYKILNYRDDTPDEVNYVILIDEYGQPEDSEFTLNPQGLYWKKMKIIELPNAFVVKTFAKYNDTEVEVFPKGNNLGYVVATSNEQDAVKAGLIKTNTNWYTQDTQLNELSEIRENYSPSSYSLPMPPLN